MSEPTGRTRAPLSETAYRTSAAGLRMALPMMFSGIMIFSRTVRLSASRMDKIGVAAAPVEEPGMGDGAAFWVVRIWA